MDFGLTVPNQNHENKIQENYTLEILCAVCTVKKAISLLLLQRTENLQTSWTLNMKFGLVKPH